MKVQKKKIAAAALLAVLVLGTGVHLATDWPMGFFGRMGWIEGNPETCPLGSKLGRTPDFIAHAGGEAAGARYTNSLEAVRASLDSGWRFIEVDLRRTLDGRYFGAHKVKEFNARTGRASRWVLPPFADDLRTLRIDGRFTPVLLSDLVPLFKAHPEAVLVTDKARGYKSLLAEFPLPDQLLVEVSNADEYYAALAAGIRMVAVNTKDWDEVERAGIRMMVASPEWLSTQGDRPKRFLESGGCILAASLSDCGEAGRAAERGAPATLYYCDRCAAFGSGARP